LANRDRNRGASCRVASTRITYKIRGRSCRRNSDRSAGSSSGSAARSCKPLCYSACPKRTTDNRQRRRTARTYQIRSRNARRSDTRGLEYDHHIVRRRGTRCICDRPAQGIGRSSYAIEGRSWARRRRNGTTCAADNAPRSRSNRWCIRSQSRRSTTDCLVWASICSGRVGGQIDHHIVK
jgi:hypothetical protein